MVLMVMLPLEIKCQDGLHLDADGEVGSPLLVMSASLLTLACLLLWG